MYLGNTFNKLDKLFNRLFKIDSVEEYEHYARRNQLEEKYDILHDASLIDNKCGVLLSHISIMFVVLGLFISSESGQGIFYFILIVEFIAYVVAAMLTLRCLDLMGPPYKQLPETEDEIRLAILEEITIRRGVYVRVLRLIYILTFILIPIVILRYLDLLNIV